MTDIEQRPFSCDKRASCQVKDTRDKCGALVGWWREDGFWEGAIKLSYISLTTRSLKKNVSIIPLPLTSMTPRGSKLKRSPSKERVVADT
jgi:hypothetical protein